MSTEDRGLHNSEKIAKARETAIKRICEERFTRNNNPKLAERRKRLELAYDPLRSEMAKILGPGLNRTSEALLRINRENNRENRPQDFHQAVRVRREGHRFVPEDVIGSQDFGPPFNFGSSVNPPSSTDVTSGPNVNENGQCDFHIYVYDGVLTDCLVWFVGSWNPPPSTVYLLAEGSFQYDWKADWTSLWWLEAAGSISIGLALYVYDQSGTIIGQKTVWKTLYAFDDRNFNDNGHQTGTSPSPADILQTDVLLAPGTTPSECDVFVLFDGWANGHTGTVGFGAAAVDITGATIGMTCWASNAPP
jgi:hypothetical protein